MTNEELVERLNDGSKGSLAELRLREEAAAAIQQLMAERDEALRAYLETSELFTALRKKIEEAEPVATLSCDGAGYWYPDKQGTKLYTLEGIKE